MSPRGMLNSVLDSRHDPFDYLPRKPFQNFDKGELIYGPQYSAQFLYLVFVGRVKLTCTIDGGSEMVARIVSPEGLFGESAIVGAGGLLETALALEKVVVMAWTRQEIESRIESEPRLGIALMQDLVRQGSEPQERLEISALYKTPERVMLALVQLAAALGALTDDGHTRIPAMTQQTIADYVGTSREIVTHEMNRLRRLGLLRYSRKHIDVYVQALEERLRAQGVGTNILRDKKAGPS